MYLDIGKIPDEAILDIHEFNARTFLELAMAEEDPSLSLQNTLAHLFKYHTEDFVSLWKYILMLTDTYFGIVGLPNSRLRFLTGLDEEEKNKFDLCIYGLTTEELYAQNKAEEEQKDVRRALNKSSEPKIKKRGYVYIIRMNAYIKIGISKKPVVRIQEQLQPRLPEIPELLYLSPELEGYEQLENKLHEQYSEHRTNGEWFLMTKEETEILISELPKEE